ncbi:hypothetical protein D3C73_1223240 [compost metagenome]
MRKLRLHLIREFGIVLCQEQISQYRARRLVLDVLDRFQQTFVAVVARLFGFLRIRGFFALRGLRFLRRLLLYRPFQLLLYLLAVSFRLLCIHLDAGLRFLIGSLAVIPLLRFRRRRAGRQA